MADMTSAVQTQDTLSDRVAMEILVQLTRRRMSQRELARRLGKAPGWVSYRLTGQQVINFDDLEEIAAVLGVRPLALVPAEDRDFINQYGGLADRPTDHVAHHEHTRPSGPPDARPRTQHGPSRPPATARPAALLRSGALSR